MDHLGFHHSGWFLSHRSWHNQFPAHMSDTEGEDPFCWHDPHFLRTHDLRQQFGMLLKRKSLGHLERGPKLVFASFSLLVSRPQNDVSRKWVVLDHVIKSSID